MSNSNPYGAVDGILQIWQAHRHHNLVLNLLWRNAMSRADEDEFRKELREANPNLSCVDIESIIEDDRFTRQIEFEIQKRTQMQLAIASLFGLFEHTMVRIAEAVLQDCSLEVSFTDFTGSGVVGAKLILTKLEGIEKAFSTENWKRVDDARMLRNKIMHSGGLVERSWDKLECLQQKKVVEVEPFGDGSVFLFAIPTSDFVRRCEYSFRAVIEDTASELGRPIDQLKLVR